MPENDNEYITPEEMRELESKASSKGITTEFLMENAGRGIANEIEVNFGSVVGRNVVVVAGKGNNGGDGLVTARYLVEKGARVTVILLANPDEIRTNEAKDNWVRLDATKLVAGGVEELLKFTDMIVGATVVVAAILGTGFQGDVREPEATAIRLINQSDGMVVAVDIPSGLDPKTGEAKNPTVRADLTVTLHRPKTGLKGNEKWTGKLVTVPIGLD